MIPSSLREAQNYCVLVRVLRWMYSAKSDADKFAFLYKLQLLLSLNSVVSVSATDNAYNSMPLCFNLCPSAPLFIVMAPKPALILSYIISLLSLFL